MNEYDLICYGLEPMAVAALNELAARGWKVLGLEAFEALTLLYPDPEGFEVEGLWHGYPSPLAQCCWDKAPRGTIDFPVERGLKVEALTSEPPGWRCRLADGQGKTLELRSRWWVDSVPGGPLHHGGFTQHRQVDPQSRCQWLLECEQELEDLRLLTLEEGWAAAIPAGPGQVQLLWTGLCSEEQPDLQPILQHPELRSLGLKATGPGLHHRFGCTLAHPLYAPGWVLTDQAAGVTPLFAPQPFQAELAIELAEALDANPESQVAFLGHYAQEVRDNLSRSQKQLAYLEAGSEEIGHYWTRKPRASDEFELKIDDKLNFDCEMCAKCCSEFSVKIEEPLRQPVREFYMQLPLQHRPLPEPFAENSVGNVALLQSERGCVFLKEDNLCRIHSDLAEEKKPVACRMFPFSFTQTPEGITAQPSFACTSVQKNSGRSLEAHRAQLEKLAREYRSRLHLPVPIELVVGFHFSTPGYRSMLAALEQTDDLPTRLRSVATKLGRWVVLGGPEPTDWDGDEEFPDAELIRFWVAFLLAESCEQEAHGHPDDLRLPDYDWHDTLEEIQRLPQLADFEAHRDRYLKGLLRSDGLLSRGQMLGSLLMYLVADEVLAALIRLYARRAQREPVVEDLYDALTVLEGQMVSHRRPPGFTRQATVQFLDAIYMDALRPRAVT